LHTCKDRVSRGMYTLHIGDFGSFLPCALYAWKSDQHALLLLCARLQTSVEYLEPKPSPAAVNYNLILPTHAGTDAAGGGPQEYGKRTNKESNKDTDRLNAMLVLENWTVTSEPFMGMFQQACTLPSGSRSMWSIAAVLFLSPDGQSFDCRATPSHWDIWLGMKVHFSNEVVAEGAIRWTHHLENTL
jgi:hypothetical protein